MVSGTAANEGNGRFRHKVPIGTWRVDGGYASSQRDDGLVIQRAEPSKGMSGVMAPLRERRSEEGLQRAGLWAEERRSDESALQRSDLGVGMPPCVLRLTGEERRQDGERTGAMSRKLLRCG